MLRLAITFQRLASLPGRNGIFLVFDAAESNSFKLGGIAWMVHSMNSTHGRVNILLARSRTFRIPRSFLRAPSFTDGDVTLLVSVLPLSTTEMFGDVLRGLVTERCCSPVATNTLLST